MIDQGVDGICILANYSEQFLLSDAGAHHAARSLPVACRRPRAGDRDLQPFLHPHRGRARPPGRRGRREDADDDAALSRRDLARRRRRDRRAVRARRRGRARADHGAGRAAERRDALGGAAGAARARGAARRLFQDRGAGHRRQAAPADRSRRRGDQGAVRRRGIDHADGRSRCRRDRHDAERAAARPDQAGRDASPRRPARRGGRRLCGASCR